MTAIKHNKYYDSTIITSTMFSFLRTGDINNSIRGLTNLPGLFTSDGDKIKYALLNHSTAMRKNLVDGAPILQGIRQSEAELERRDIASITSGRLPSVAAASILIRSSLASSPGPWTGLSSSVGLAG